MKILLTTEKAQEIWGKNALISLKDEAWQIHIGKNKLQDIQKAGRKLKTQGCTKVELSGDNWDLDACLAFFNGFDSVKNKGEILTPCLSEEITEVFQHHIRCLNFVKELINAPASELTPVILANKAGEFLKNLAPNAVSFKVLTGKELQERELNGIITVGKGSVNEPAFLELDFNPLLEENNLNINPQADQFMPLNQDFNEQLKDSIPVFACLVGKGITFDTGGYNLKLGEGMTTMKSDMGGSALLTGALGLAILLGLKKRIKLFLCCAENMISEQAFKAGDIIKYKNGTTVEVLNTDAEGRLVLADGLIEASANKPEFIINAATLTGAAKVAVGRDYHSIFSMDEKLVNDLLQTAKNSNELFWRLPFAEFHRSRLDSPYADIANISTSGYGDAGASTSCAFLSYFVENYSQHWLHIDASATFRASADALWGAGATAIGVRTLANLLLQG